MAKGSTEASPPGTPKDTYGQESPTSFIIAKDSDLANNAIIEDGTLREDEPSAADYDPTMDMQEDKIRQDQQFQKDDIPSVAYDETTGSKQDVLLPKGSSDNSELVQEMMKKTKDEFDMFADEDDMFAEIPIVAKAEGFVKEAAKAVPVPLSQALDMGTVSYTHLTLPTKA